MNTKLSHPQVSPSQTESPARLVVDTIVNTIFGFVFLAGLVWMVYLAGFWIEGM